MASRVASKLHQTVADVAQLTAISAKSYIHREISPFNDAHMRDFPVPRGNS